MSNSTRKLKPEPQTRRSRKVKGLPYRPRSITFSNTAKTPKLKSKVFFIGQHILWEERIKLSWYTPFSERTRTIEGRITDITLTPSLHRTLHIEVLSSSGIKSREIKSKIHRKESVLIRNYYEILKS